MVICIIVSITAFFSGCIEDVCPYYVQSTGIINNIYSTQHNCRTKHEQYDCYNIYAEIYKQNSINDTCNASIRKNAKNNITTFYNIDDTVTIYIDKLNNNKCIIDINGQIEANMFTSFIFFFFLLLCLIYICCTQMNCIQTDKQNKLNKIQIIDKIKDDISTIV